MYTSVEEYEAYFEGLTAPAPYERYERSAVAKLRESVCFSFPTLADFELLDLETQAMVKEAIILQINHRYVNEATIRDGVKDVTIGKYREKVDAAMIESLKLSDDAVTVLMDSGVCTVWLEDGEGDCFD